MVLLHRNLEVWHEPSTPVAKYYLYPLLRCPVLM